MTVRMLMIGDCDPTCTCAHRAAAFERLGLTVHRLDTRPYATAGGRIAAALRVRLLNDPATFLFNRAVKHLCHALRPDIVWFDKPTFLHPDTLRDLRPLGAILIQHTLDNPFSLLPGEPGWRRIRQCLPHFDLNVVPRPHAVEEFSAAGSPTTLVMPLAFDPITHYPHEDGPPSPDLPLTFIGSPYDNRPAFLATLSDTQCPVAVFGDGWSPHRAIGAPWLTLKPGVHGPAYRAHIWRALACLGFVTHAHRDPTAHRSFEITGCGGVLLAERTEAHLAAFTEDKDCLYFGDVEEARDKALFLARSPAARARFARAGAARAWRSGYSNDERQATLLATLDPRRFGALPALARSTVAQLAPWD